MRFTAPLGLTVFACLAGCAAQQGKGRAAVAAVEPAGTPGPAATPGVPSDIRTIVPGPIGSRSSATLVVLPIRSRSDGTEMAFSFAEIARATGFFREVRVGDDPKLGDYAVLGEWEVTWHPTGLTRKKDARQTANRYDTVTDLELKLLHKGKRFDTITLKGAIATNEWVADYQHRTDIVEPIYRNLRRQFLGAIERMLAHAAGNPMPPANTTIATAPTPEPTSPEANPIATPETIAHVPSDTVATPLAAPTPKPAPAVRDAPKPALTPVPATTIVSAGTGPYGQYFGGVANGLNPDFLVDDGDELGFVDGVAAGWRGRRWLVGGVWQYTRFHGKGYDSIGDTHRNAIFGGVRAGFRPTRVLSIVAGVEAGQFQGFVPSTDPNPAASPVTERSGLMIGNSLGLVLDVPIGKHFLLGAGVHGGFYQIDGPDDFQGQPMVSGVISLGFSR